MFKRVAGSLATRFFYALGVVAVVAGCVAASASAALPQVNETWVEDVSATAAVLHARLDSGGLSSTYRFDYIADSAYMANLQAGREGFFGAARTPEPEGNPGKGSNNLVTRQVTGLQGETGYRYRVVIRNADGTTPGPERVLTTKGVGGPLALLDDRGWEMVSPVDKNGGEIQGPGAIAGGGVFQAAAQGGAVTYSSVSSFGPGAGGAPEGSQYVSRRGAAGWGVENVTAPLVAGAYGEAPDGVPYQLFSGDLLLGLLSSLGGYELREPSGAFTAVTPPPGLELGFAGASPDLEHLVFASCAAGGSCDPAASDLYERSAAGWRLLNASPGRLAASSGAISSDGSRVYWTDGADLYLSEGGAGTVQVDEGAGGGGTFQAASADGSVAFFSRAGSLYRYDVATQTTTDLTPGGGVLGVFGASADGTTVYYATTAGLFADRGGSATGPFAAAADASNFPPSVGTARVSADGSRLAFLSSAELTAYDNTEPSGNPAPEAYLYDANAERLTCVSCNPTGERPRGPSAIPGATANGQGEGATRAYKPRSLSTDGKRLFFDSYDALVPADTNGNQRDVYEWEAGGSGSCVRAAGCLQLISAGSSHGSSFVDAGPDGGDVFFLTDNSLVKSDPGSVDIYDARAGGGFAEAEPPFVCEEDACQPLPPAPDDPSPGSLVPNLGNPPVHFPKVHKKKRHHKKQHGRGASRR